MDAYDAATEHALENGDDPEEYLRSLEKRKQEEAQYIAAANRAANEQMVHLCALQADYSRVKIKTDCVCPPIPLRHYDWNAIDDNTYDVDFIGGEDDAWKGGMIGHGATESEAVVDLIEQIAARDDVDPFEVLLAICDANAKEKQNALLPQS